MLLAVVITYCLLCLLAIRPIAGHIAWKIAEKYDQKGPQGEDWLAGICGAVLVCVLWPAMLVLYQVNKHSPAIGAEKRMKQKKRLNKLEKLERELELQ